MSVMLSCFTTHLLGPGFSGLVGLIKLAFDSGSLTEPSVYLLPCRKQLAVFEAGSFARRQAMLCCQLDSPDDGDSQKAMASRIHHVEQHRSAILGIEAMTLYSDHHYPRHSHDQLGIGVIAFGAQRSWSGFGHVNASAGDVIMVNPGEMHDGAPLQGNPREWRMLYL